jgi:L-asparaginase
VSFGSGPLRRRVRLGPTVVLDVPMFAVYPDMSGGAIQAAVAAGARGLVVEGTGLGNVPPHVAEALAEVLAAGVPVVLARRPREGRAAAIYGGAGGGGTLATLGAVPGGDLPAHKARIALMVALGVDPTIDGVRRWFEDL